MFRPTGKFYLSSTAIALALAVGILAAAGVAHAGGTRTCYSAMYDRDGDGYASAEAPGVQKSNSGTNCPSGWVRFNNDCNDFDAGIHPRRGEIPYDGIDNNCTGGADEPEVIYDAAGNGNTTSGFSMTVLLNDLATMNARDDLWAEVELTNLNDSQHPTKLPWVRVTGLASDDPFTTIQVFGLAPTTVYSAVVRFFRPALYRPVLRGGAPRSYVQVGPASSPYYTTTDGNGAISQARTKILLRGFKEIDESERGKVGYRGTVKRDGTRYGASTNEKWCTEFYVWVTKPFLRYLDSVRHLYYYPDNVDGEIVFFRLSDSYYDAYQVAGFAARGDYMPADTDNNGSKNHSTMFLAVDVSYSPLQVWTLEGNIGDNVYIGRRTIAPNGGAPFEVKGLGHIASWMLQ